MTERDDQAAPRFRIDEFAVSPEEAPTHSGRRFVIVAVLILIVLWGTLQVVFRVWRAGYRDRAAFGATQVAPAIDPLAKVVPPGVEPQAWREVVDETHEALVTLTAANLLDLPQMKELRDTIGARVARAHARPETARDELAGLWNDLANQAGPILDARHPRPKLLPPRPAAAPRRRQPRESTGQVFPPKRDAPCDSRCYACSCFQHKISFKYSI
ncbi:hypothetical protein [Singulisphaera acidiphila]|uniref:Uncharacterized protein n=1 Tax=Singulisphaera acidiphila (strain ATCC BAA-1392 / DSM 18658 / VKM B-2454 / MOB10) TaxID=886293 RepID=L0DRF2_SINAD|nr:hypothetical protein [Singulisphaera acidiphila]AGA31580.1 hypothetical protein Sinac_7547 [Singulisphaera acidiphila DSM 18658]